MRVILSRKGFDSTAGGVSKPDFSGWAHAFIAYSG